MAFKLVATGLPDLVPMDRSEGRHVSAAIRRLCIKFGHFDDSPFPDDKTRMELGSAFEDGLADFLARRIVASNPERYIRIGEQVLDGIYGTPDILDLETMTIIEVKLTWLSTKNDPDGKKFWKYWTQIKAYCHMLGIRRGQLWICHINGDYRGSGPIMNVWEPDAGEFSEDELRTNWSMIRAYS